MYREGITGYDLIVGCTAGAFMMVIASGIAAIPVDFLLDLFDIYQYNEDMRLLVFAGASVFVGAWVLLLWTERTHEREYATLERELKKEIEMRKRVEELRRLGL